MLHKYIILKQNQPKTWFHWLLKQEANDEQQKLINIEQKGNRKDFICKTGYT